MFFEGIDIYTGRVERIEVIDGQIARIEEKGRGRIDSGLPYLSRSFIDMQVNGYRGVDYSGENLSLEQIRTLVSDLAASGTCRHVPTIITNSEQRIEKNLRMISRAVASDSAIANAIVGVHIEGPFISEEDGPRGAHDRKYIRDPNIEELKRWQSAAGGLVKLVTIAPERQGATEFIRYASEMGVVVAIGHCAPDAGQIKAAIAAGARLCTHLGNGSHARLPRLRNYIWEQLAEDSLSAGIIADGFHLPSSVLKTFLRTKGYDRLILVSDVALLGGNAPGVFKWGDIDVEVFADGHLGLAGTELLAGAGHLLDWDIPVFMKATGASLLDAIRLVTVNPSRILGLARVEGGFKEGEKADIISFFADGAKLRVQSYCYATHERRPERDQS